MDGAIVNIIEGPSLAVWSKIQKRLVRYDRSNDGRYRFVESYEPDKLVEYMKGNV